MLKRPRRLIVARCSCSAGDRHGCRQEECRKALRAHLTKSGKHQHRGPEELINLSKATPVESEKVWWSEAEDDDEQPPRKKPNEAWVGPCTSEERCVCARDCCLSTHSCTQQRVCGRRCNFVPCNSLRSCKLYPDSGWIGELRSGPAVEQTATTSGSAGLDTCSPARSTNGEGGQGGTTGCDSGGSAG